MSEIVMDEAMLGRLRELVQAGKAGGWQEVLAALDMGDIVLALRGDRGALKKAVEVTGLSAPTLWRRGKLATHREAIEDARPANLTEALRLAKRLDAEAGAQDDEGAAEEEEKPKRGRPKRDPVEVLTDRLKDTASKLADSGALSLDKALGMVEDAYADAEMAAKAKAEIPVLLAAMRAAMPGTSDATQSPEPAENFRREITAQVEPRASSLHEPDDPTERELLTEPTLAIVWREGQFGYRSASDMGPKFTSIKVGSGPISMATERSSMPWGPSTREALLIVAYKLCLDDLPNPPDEGQFATPEQYRDYWTAMVRAYRDAPAEHDVRILFSNIGPKLFDSYPERLAKRRQDEEDRQRYLQEERQREEDDARFKAEAWLRVTHADKPLRCTSVRRGDNGLAYVEELTVKSLTYGKHPDGLVHLSWSFRPKGGGSTGSSLAHWKEGEPRGFLLLKGYRVGIVEVGEHGFYQGKLKWDDAVSRARGCGAEILIDAVPPTEPEAA